MPLYEYQCDSCGHRFEVIQKFSDPPVEACPKCGSAVRKLVSSPAFQFKGSGWYVTDYAKKDSGGDKGSDKNGEKGGDKAADKTSGAAASASSAESAKPAETKSTEAKPAASTDSSTKTTTPSS